MENFVGQFYEMAKSSPVEQTAQLNTFVTDFDIESLLAEHESLSEVDLSKLLRITLNDS
jgi:hypothetical protein